MKTARATPLVDIYEVRLEQPFIQTLLESPALLLLWIGVESSLSERTGGDEDSYTRQQQGGNIH